MFQSYTNIVRIWKMVCATALLHGAAKGNDTLSGNRKKKANSLSFLPAWFSSSSFYIFFFLLYFVFIFLLSPIFSFFRSHFPFSSSTSPHLSAQWTLTGKHVEFTCVSHTINYSLESFFPGIHACSFHSGVFLPEQVKRWGNNPWEQAATTLPSRTKIH